MPEKRLITTPTKMNHNLKVYRGEGIGLRAVLGGAEGRKM